MENVVGELVEAREFNLIVDDNLGVYCCYSNVFVFDQNRR